MLLEGTLTFINIYLLKRTSLILSKLIYEIELFKIDIKEDHSVFETLLVKVGDATVYCGPTSFLKIKIAQS